MLSAMSAARKNKFCRRAPAIILLDFDLKLQIKMLNIQNLNSKITEGDIKMKKKLVGLNVIWLVVLLILPLQVYAEDAKGTVETQINKMLARMQEPSFKEQPRDAKLADIRKIINEIFDYQELSARTLGRDWKKFNPQQQTEFIDLFSQLLENVYADRILAYTSEKIEYGKVTELRENQTEVESYIITKDNTKVPLFYRLVLKDGQWRVYDVVIEGVSMIKNYRGQFREMLANKTPEDLLQTLREKVKEKPAS
jgi:phospholipid transport system substrate-binding protein